MKLTKQEQTISDLLYESLDYMYCDNCRFNFEISEEEAIKEYGYWGCEDCHRKYNGWGISRNACDILVEKISKIIGEK